MSLKHHRHINILKFYSRLSELDSQRYASLAYHCLIKDADKGLSNWVSKARSLRAIYGIEDSDNLTTIKMKVKNLFESEVLDKLRSQVVDDKKLKLYSSFKQSFKFEPYLDFLHDYNIRSSLAKLRLSSHNLHIESGRFGKTTVPRSERLCPYCKMAKLNLVENEVHFIMSCPLYKVQRKQMLGMIFQKFPNTAKLNEENMFFWLMSQEEKDVIESLGHFCNKSFERRKRFLLGPQLLFNNDDMAC